MCPYSTCLSPLYPDEQENLIGFLFCLPAASFHQASSPPTRSPAGALASWFLSRTAVITQREGVWNWQQWDYDFTLPPAGICIDFKPLEICSSAKWPWNYIIEDFITHPLTQCCRPAQCQRRKPLFQWPTVRKQMFGFSFFLSKQAHSLIAPVQPHGDVALDLTSLVLGEMTLDQLPTQVDELIHHMTQLVEQVHLVFLLSQGRFS